MRVGVVDLGTNSTRLLVADVEDGRVTRELHRESRVTRLGQGVDTSGALAEEAIERVFAVLDDYRRTIGDLAAEETVAVLTSAVRDARNGARFAEAIRTRYRLDAHTIPGAEEAALTFLGATSERARTDDAAVIDIGGGSTEIVVGRGDRVGFFVSTQMGVVRQTERHLKTDPPTPDELTALATEAAAIVEREVPATTRAAAKRAIAVAGTATSSAAIDLALDAYDPDRVHGHVIPLGRLEELLARLVQMPNAERREVVGLHPDRAPTIVAGLVILVEVLRAFALDEVEVSEHDILRGAALRRATAPD